jgi:hypothetical protein
MNPKNSTQKKSLDSAAFQAKKLQISGPDRRAGMECSKGFGNINKPVSD